MHSEHGAAGWHTPGRCAGQRAAFRSTFLRCTLLCFHQELLRNQMPDAGSPACERAAATR